MTFSFSNYEIWADYCCMYLSEKEDIQNFTLTCKGIRFQVIKTLENLIRSFFIAKSQEQENSRYEDFAARLSIISPKNQHQILFFGEKYRIQGLYKKAMLYFERLSFNLITDAALLPFATTAKATTALWKKEFEIARTLIEQSLNLNTNYIPTRLCYFDLFRSQDFQTALEGIQAVSLQDPENVHMRRYLIEAAFYTTVENSEEKQAIQKQAIQALEALVQGVRSTYVVHLRILLADMYILGKKPHLALNILKEAINVPTIDDTLVAAIAHIKIVQLISSNKSLEHNYTPPMRIQLLKKASTTATFEELCSILNFFVDQKLFEWDDKQEVVDICNQILKIDLRNKNARKLRGIASVQKGIFSEQAVEDLYFAYLQDKADGLVREFLIQCLLSRRVSENSELLQELLNITPVQQRFVPENTSKNTPDHMLNKIPLNFNPFYEPPEQKEMAPEELCKEYFASNFQEKLQKVQNLQKAAKKLLNTDQEHLGRCCLGEASMVLGNEDQMDFHFSLLGEWANNFIKSSGKVLFVRGRPSIEFYLISRATSCLIKTARDTKNKDVEKYGFQILETLHNEYPKDSFVEALLLTQEDKVTLRGLERVLLLDSNNSFVVQRLSTALSNCQASQEVYQLLDKSLEDLTKLYPRKISLLMTVAFVKSKLKDDNSVIIWKCYSHVIKMLSDPKTKEEKQHYSDALIFRANLFIAKQFSHYDYEQLENDVEKAYAFCQDPQLLLSVACIFKNYAPYFTKKAYLEALKYVCKAYMFIGNQNTDLAAFISELYAQGGFGILKSEEVKTFWLENQEDPLSAEDCIAIAEITDEKAEALLYAAKAFKKSRKQEAYDLLIRVSSQEPPRLLTKETTDEY